MSSAATAESKKKKGSEVKVLTLADRPNYTKAVRLFLEEYRTVESSRALDDVMIEIEKASKLGEVFQIPLKHKLLNLEGALRFLLFLSVAKSKDEEPFTGGAKIDPHAALETIAKVYDDGIHDGVWAYVDGALESDSDTETEPEPEFPPISDGPAAE